MLDLSTEYPGQIDTSDPSHYPYGKARNESTPGARDGTPLEARLVNDIFGFFQGLLTAAGMTPSGIAEKITGSQLVTAVYALALQTVDGLLGSSQIFAGRIRAVGGFKSDSDVTTDGDANIGRDVTVTRNAAITGSITGGGAASFGTTVADPVDLKGATKLFNPLLFSALGRLRLRHRSGIDSAGLTYSASYNWIHWPPMTAANRTATIDTDGGDGDLMLVSLGASTVNLTVNFPSGGATVTLPGDSALHAALFAHNGTAWEGPLLVH